MFDPMSAIHDSTIDHPYRTAPPPSLDLDGSRIPYDGQARMRLTISSGLAHARVVVDPAARDLFAVDCGGGPRPWIRLAGGDLAVSWRHAFGDWLRDLFAPRFGDVVILLHPAVEWTVALRGGLADVELDLAAGKLARLDVAGGCSDVLLDLPAPTSVVPVRVSGGASHLRVRRPAEVDVGLGVAGGVSALHFDERAFDAIGGAVQLGAAPREAPHYELMVSGGASDLSIERW